VPHHPHHAIQLYTLGNLRAEVAATIEQRDEALGNLAQARASLVICFGDAHAIVVEIGDLIHHYASKEIADL
jgi:hypothetical protein